MEVQFWQHYNRRDKQYATIYIRITMDGKRADIGSSGVRILAAHWDPGRRQVLPDEAQSQFYNQKLLAIESRLNAIYNEFFINGDPFTVHEVKARYFGNATRQKITLIEAFDRFLKANDLDPRLAKSTRVKRKHLRAKLVSYLILHKKQHLPAEDFDLSELELFRHHLEVDLRHEYSYVWKILATVKQMLTWAKLRKLIHDMPLEGLRLEREKEKPITFLTARQVANLRDVPFDNPTLQKVADAFVVYCRTGFHYRDLKEVTQAPDIKLRRGIDGQQWIYHSRVKTDVEAKVPVFWEEIQPIVEKYGGWRNLPILSNVNMNHFLKVIAAARKLPPKLCVKHGRSTLANWLLNERGWDKDAVKVVMGLKTDACLAKYGKPDERRVLLAIERERSLIPEKNLVAKTL